MLFRVGVNDFLGGVDGPLYCCCVCVCADENGDPVNDPIPHKYNIRYHRINLPLLLTYIGVLGL